MPGQPTRLNGSGKSFPTYGTTTDKVIISLLTNGLAAADIEKCLKVLSEQIPALMHGKMTPDDDRPRTIPSISYIEKMTNSLAHLNAERVKDFVNEAETIFLAADDRYMCFTQDV